MLLLLLRLGNFLSEVFFRCPFFVFLQFTLQRAVCDSFGVDSILSGDAVSSVVRATSACSLVVPNTNQKLLQFHLPVFHAFADVFLKEHRNAHTIKSLPQFPDLSLAPPETHRRISACPGRRVQCTLLRGGWLLIHATTLAELGSHHPTDVGKEFLTAPWSPSVRS